MVGTRKSLALVIALAISGVAAACGPSNPPDTAADKQQDTAPAGTGTQDTTTPPAGSKDPQPTPPATGAPSGTAEAPAPKPGKGSTPIKESKMLEDVKKAGVNLAKTTTLDKIPLGQKKKLMPLFQKALGYKDCQGCHVEGDFKKETRNIKITRGMWDHYVAAMRDEKGGAVFCDTCHEGTPKNLDRSDRKAMEKFMEDEYEHKLTRADKKDNECSTCHGDAMELKIIEKLWGIAKN
ncbi:multiheme c-type cytochrome [Polyangium aurulentum]|uniref:multiheme c-type cytochrome n=1 Tax=Polyangium aurulentum TaxID=2567896 RepID=UPI0010AEDF01|nr:cytochrome c3 family protein [Polyangium aurulentum]UQA58726.1 hypothetical protein E8A73_047100 [Polyangium aurulentum]